MLKAKQIKYNEPMQFFGKEKQHGRHLPCVECGKGFK